MAQNVSDLKLAIVELDGCVLPLNHYRYNFYKNLCKKNDVALNHKTFYNALGNMYTMYDSLPLSETVDSVSLNQKVEEELFDYLNTKGQKANDGVIELFEYLRQKDVKIAIVTTHKTKNAIAYLELAGLYNKVDYIIGNDTKLQPLPSTDIFEFLMDKYQVTANQTLLVTSILSMLKAGDACKLNMIYLEDLVPAGEEEKALSYKVSAGMYETLNDIIFGRYEDYKMYEAVLGFDEDMAPEELHEVHKHLEDVYNDDEDLLDIVNKTYEFRLSELNVSPEELNQIETKEEPTQEVVEEVPEVEEPVKEEVESPQEEEQESEDDEYFAKIYKNRPEVLEETPQEDEEEEDTDLDDLLGGLDAIDEELEDVKNKSSMSQEENEDDEEVVEDDEEEVLEEDAEEPDEEKGALSLDIEKTIELDDAISKVMATKTRTDLPIFDDEDDEYEEDDSIDYEEKNSGLKKFGDIVITVLYTFALSLVILVIGLIVYIALQSQFDYGVLKFVKNIYLSYASLASTIFGFIINIFKNNNYLSKDGASLLAVYCLNTLIIAIVEVVLVLLKRNKNDA